MRLTLQSASILSISADTDAALLPTTLYIDADACLVKDEAVRVAERHGLEIYFVSNAYMRLPEGPLIKRVVVSDGPDAADDWIAERATKGDIVVTADIALAARCLKAGRIVHAAGGRGQVSERSTPVPSPRGRLFRQSRLC